MYSGRIACVFYDHACGLWCWCLQRFRPVYYNAHSQRTALSAVLCCFRTVIGDGYLPAAMAVQGILTALGITVLSEYLTRRFHLHFWEEVLVVLLQLLPHLMTRYVSALHIFLEIR